jgi:hypothetical protein
MGIGLGSLLFWKISEALNFGYIQQHDYSIVLYCTRRALFLANAYHDITRDCFVVLYFISQLSYLLSCLFSKGIN